MTGPVGLIARPSRHGPQETMGRLVAAVTARGLTVFARVDHGAAAAAAGLPLRPTELLIFGSAPVGTPLMQAAPTIAIDLPLKALVWQDNGGTTWLAYNDPHWIAERHGLTADTVPVLHAMTEVLEAIARQATADTHGGPG